MSSEFKRIPTNILKSKTKLKDFIFEYIEKNNNKVNNRDILIGLQYLGYIWNWNENTNEISNIKKGKFKNLSVINIEDTITETMDLSLEETHTYIANGIINHNTINAPNNASIEDVKELFLYAYDKGLKGITYFRDGSRLGVLRKVEKEEKEQEVTELERMFLEAGNNVITENVKIPFEPPVKLYKRTDKNKKKWYFFIAFADRNYKVPFSFFIKTNNYAGSDVADWVISNMERLLFEKGIDKEIIVNQIKKYSGQNNIDKIARTISMALRHNISIIDIVKTIDCEIEFSSLLFHIKKILEQFIPDGTKLNIKCPECENDLVYAEGCAFCPACSYSKCG